MFYSAARPFFSAVFENSASRRRPPRRRTRLVNNGAAAAAAAAAAQRRVCDGVEGLRQGRRTDRAQRGIGFPAMFRGTMQQ